jgi:hypothetical protein
MNANGDAVVAWTESVSGNWQVAAALRTGGNNPSWGKPNGTALAAWYTAPTRRAPPRAWSAFAH